MENIVAVHLNSKWYVVLYVCAVSVQESSDIYVLY
jgi:hypothetical protein